MEEPVNHRADEHTIDLTTRDTAAASELICHSSAQNDSTSSPMEYRLIPLTKGWFNFDFGSCPGLWIFVELAIIVSQCAAAVILFPLSRNEHSQGPLLVWIIGYTSGCVATLPRLCWRFIHRNDQGLTHDSAHSHQDSEETLCERSRYGKYILAASPSTFYVEWFFLVWFLVGDALVYDKHPHSQYDPILFRGFLAYSSLLMLAIITVRERAIRKEGNTHKFKLKTRQIGDESKPHLGSKGRTISAEDAVCCICLGDYMEDDELQELPCTHIFHMECVDLWLQKNPTCPICKKFALFGSNGDQQKYGAL